MYLKQAWTALFIASLALPAFAQDVVKEVDCNDPKTAQEEESCTGLPPLGDEITNFVPLVAPALGGLLVAAALAGGASGGSTSTTGTGTLGQ